MRKSAGLLAPRPDPPIAAIGLNSCVTVRIRDERSVLAMELGDQHILYHRVTVSDAIRGKVVSLKRLHRHLGEKVANTMRAVSPSLLFGLRLWGSVCLALYVAFWLQLSNPYWAGTTAALVCQPHLGAALRRGWFRMIGTIVGAVATVVLTACFPQDRAAFLVGLS